MRIITSFLLFSISCFAQFLNPIFVGTSNWYDPAWTYRKLITLDHTKVPNTVTGINAPPVFWSPSSDSDVVSYAKTGGEDLRFTAADGVTLLPFELTHPQSTNMLLASGTTTMIDEPPAIEYNGTVYIGYLSGEGSIMIYSYKRSNGDQKIFCLKRQFYTASAPVDWHTTPALVILPSGKIAAFWDAHNGVGRYRVSTNAEDISAWDAERVFPTNVSGTNGYSYINAAWLTVTGKLYLFLRGADWTPVMIVCDNEAAVTGGTCNNAFSFINTSYGDARPYLTFHTNSTDKIWFAVSEIDGGSSYKGFHMVFNGNTGNFEKADGTVIGSFASPVPTNLMDQVIYTPSYRPYLTDITIDGSGYPVVASIVTGATYITAYYSRWTGSAWTTSSGINIGPISLPLNNLNAVLDHSNANVMLLPHWIDSSTMALEKYTTSNGGSSFSSEEIARSGTILHPRFVRGYSTTALSILWDQNASGWTSSNAGSSYLDFHFDIYTNSNPITQKTNTKDAAWIKLSSLSSTVDTQFYVYFGNSAATDASTPSSVWSDYNFVYHGNEINTTSIQEAKTGRIATKIGTSLPSEVSGKLNKAVYCNSTGAYLLGEPFNIAGATLFSVEAWVKGNAGMIIDNYGAVTSTAATFQLSFNSNVAQGLVRMSNGSNAGGTFTGATGSTSVWHHFLMTYDQPSSKVKLYYDGTKIATDFAAANAVGSAAFFDSMLCGYPTNTTLGNSTIEEVRGRIGTLLSTDGITTNYNIAAGSFVKSVGALETH